MSDYLMKCLWKGVADVDLQQEAADRIEELEAELAEEIRVSNKRGNHIEFELLPKMSDLALRNKELEDNLFNLINTCKCKGT